jgi:hypothetical protein
MEDTVRKPRSRWKNNIEMNLEEIVYESVKWIRVAQDEVK